MTTTLYALWYLMNVVSLCFSFLFSRIGGRGHFTCSVEQGLRTKYSFDQSFYYSYENKSHNLPLAAQNENLREEQKVSLGQELQSMYLLGRPPPDKTSTIYFTCKVISTFMTANRAALPNSAT